MRIYTIGHSTRPIEEFIEILKHYEIDQLVDIRTIPASRKNPQFGMEALRESLFESGIRYVHLKGLGGLRRPKKDSLNDAWKNTSFRGYADHMQTEEFKAALEELFELMRNYHAVCIMCAEAVPWRCHRSLVGDALLVRNIEVLDIFDLKNTKEHRLTRFAEVHGTQILYPQSLAS